MLSKLSRLRLPALLCVLLTVLLLPAHAQDNPSDRRGAPGQGRPGGDRNRPRPQAGPQRPTPPRPSSQPRRQSDRQRQLEQQRRMDMARQRERERMRAAEQRRRAMEAQRRRQFQQRHWMAGQHLPRSYWDSRYYVPDWRARHLPPPAMGYQWVQIDDQFMLMQLGTGLISRVLLM